MRIFFMSLALLGFLAAPAMAQDTGEPAAETKAETAAAPANPHTAVMTEKARKLAESMTEEEAKKLGQIRENFGILRSIGIARKSVEEAADLCAGANPELAEQMTARHGEWDKEIGAALERQEKNLDRSIDQGGFANPQEIRDYFGSIEDMADYADSQLDKRIVTTLPACQNLMDSMDETSTVILGLITDMQWPGDATPSGEPAP